MSFQFESYFDFHTMSVHLKENQPVLAKRGRPGEWLLVPLTETKLDYNTIMGIADEIKEYCVEYQDGLIEVSSQNAQVIQLKNYRIVIITPPFANCIEIAIVKQTLQKSLESYSIPEILFARLRSKAEGILIAGSPGAGKSTFAAALAGFYADQDKLVKTIEKPRDLSVDERITQYTIFDDNPEKTGDILLLMRPDYVIFDELRKSRDFEVFSDLRLAGIGLVGVVHAAKAIDAIQRFITRVELGIIPSIIDTVIFIEGGEIETALSLKMSVKVPTKMKSSDLARPVISVYNFLKNDKPLYELFTFGEQIVIVPIGNLPHRNEKKFKSLNLKEIEREISFQTGQKKTIIEQIGRNTVKVFLPQEVIKSFIGRQGATVQAIERQLGVSIDVEPLVNYTENSNRILVNVIEERKQLILNVGSSYSGKNGRLFVNNEDLLSVTVDYNGTVKLSKKKASTKRILKFLRYDRAELMFIVTD